ncbi:MAG: monofunctional biosynthetic peptidoglycan transglycosylase [Aestuariivirga sp.]|uniref:monofunctional biosynthetic peptidoglycan transglycosylase n=1 Tax=Aestuariivirga sp. TaxID=2650926 RepID=UPI0038CF4AA8
MSEETQPAAAALAAESEGVAAPRRGWPRALRWALYGLGFLVAWPIVMTLVYAVAPPPFSNVMLLRALGGAGIDKQWVSLDEMSPWLPRAVIASEDARFCQHRGVDWIEFQSVIDDALERDEAPVRGASTIPMQTAKNLFLWDGRFAIRKVLELPLAMWMDLIWSKRRMMEIYLNIVEWAPGVYGAEAAAWHHFGKPAKKLNKTEAARLAAVLPNPIRRNAGKPSKGVRAIASRILVRMAGIGPYLTCLAPPSRL